MQAAILAGGLATRLRPLTESIPKSMVEIFGKPFLEYQLDFLKRNGVKDIVLCIGYLGEIIENYFRDGKQFGVDIRYSREKEKLLGTAGALKNAEDLLQNEFFVMYGDSYLFLDFNAIMSYFKKFDKLSLMVVYRNRDRYGPSNVAVENGYVKEYSKHWKTEEMIFIDYGVSVLRKKALELIPKGWEYSLEDLFPRLIGQREILYYEIYDRFYEIGNFQGLREFEDYIKRGIAK